MKKYGWETYVWMIAVLILGVIERKTSLKEFN